MPYDPDELQNLRDKGERLERLFQLQERRYKRFIIGALLTGFCLGGIGGAIAASYTIDRVAVFTCRGLQA